MIPFISNAAVTEVNSTGTLNDKAGESKSKLPIQIFRLTDNISGNLTMTNNSAHKKIFIDTNGNNILNSSGSPITNNSSTAVEIIGSGNVQSTLKTFTASQSSDSHTGTTTITNSDSSTVVVDDNHTFTSENQAVTFSSFSNSTLAAAQGGAEIRPIVPSGTTLVISGSNVTEGTTLDDTQTQAIFGTTSSHKVANFTAGFDNHSTISGTPGSSITGLDALSIGTSFTNSGGGNNVFNGFAFTNGGFVLFNFMTNSAGTASGHSFGSGSGGSGLSSGVSGMSIASARTTESVTIIASGRRIRFTNNLAIAVAITGSDNPFGSVSVSAGATQTATRDSTDGSFNITGTISGTDGSSRPYALLPVNNGTGSIVTTNHTGTLSASAL